MAASKAQPDVRITVHRLFGEPRDFTLGYPLPPELHEMLATIYREFNGRGAPDGQVIEDRMHPRLPRATRGVPGGWLTIASIRDPDRGPTARRWRLAHWPGSKIDGRHDVPSRMTPDHLKGQEYIGLRINEHGSGYHGVPEKSVAKGTISDVVAFDRDGAPSATFEIQYSGLASGRAVRRDKAVERAGIPATWLGSTDSRPEWADRVPWLGANRREGMARGSWTVASGRRAIEMEPCRPGARQDCQIGRNWCYDEHPLWQPRGGTVDDIVDGIIAGELQRFDTGKSLVIATPADCQRWIDYYRTPKVARLAEKENRRRESTNSITHNNAYPEAKILASMLVVPSRQVPECLCCNEQKWSAAVDGVCVDCNWGPTVDPGPDCAPVSVPQPRLALPKIDPPPRGDWTLQAAQRAAVDMVPSMQTYGDLCTFWHLAERNKTVTPELAEACRRRKAEIVGPNGRGDSCLSA